MAVLGHLIKSLIDVKHSLAPQIPKDAPAAQRDQLLRLLDKAKDTAFGLHYGFAELLKAEDPVQAFQQRVPIHDYDRMHTDWWSRQQEEADVSWPGMPRYFARTSGTTGKESKQIPVTDDMLASIRSVGRAQAESLSNFNLPAEFFEKDILMLSSSAQLEERNGHLEGEISGINVSNIPGWFESFYKPGLGIAKIDNWDERLAAIVAEAPNWDVGAVAGIPSWVQMMLRAIVDKYELPNIHALWPGLQVYATGGVAFEPYRESFNALLERPIIIQDTYLASEGFFAYNARPATMAMRMALVNDIFYEFVPFDNRGFDGEGNLLPNPLTLTIAEVEADKDYALLVSTPAGAWRYFIGDTIKFTDLERHEIVISGRTKYFLNVVGSQLSEEKINAAVTQLAEETGTPIKEFTVAAVRNETGEYIHQWVLGVESGHLDEAQAAERLDAILRDMNRNYAVARSKALKGVKARVVRADDIYDWLEATKQKGGQIKTPKVMKEERMWELMEFLDKVERPVEAS